MDLCQRRIEKQDRRLFIHQNPKKADGTTCCYRSVTTGNPKHEALNPKQIQMTEIKNSKQYDLEERTFQFAKRIRDFVKKIPRTISNIEDGKQLVRSSGSIGANYIEANESLSKKDFSMRIKISRKEAKESKYWLSLIDVDSGEELEEERQKLIKEATELMMIFSSIMRKSI